MVNIVFTWISSSFGGAEKSLTSLVLGLKKKNLSVTLIILDLHHTNNLNNVFQQYDNIIIINDVKNYTLYLKRKLNTGGIIFSNHRSFSFDFSILKNCNKEPIKYVIFRTNILKNNYFRYLDSNGSLVKIDNFRNYLLDLKDSDKVIGVSKYCLNSIIKEAQKHNINFASQIIYNGIADSFYQNNLSNKKGKILIASRLESWKNIEVAIDGFRIFAKKHQSYELHIAGNGSLFDSIYQSNLDLINIGKLKMLSFVNNLEEILPNYDFVIQPSKQEAFGRFIAEAGASYLFGIAPKDGAMSELIKNGVNGILIDDFNSFNLDKALNNIVENNDTELIYMKKMAFKNSFDKFHIEKCVEHYYELISTLGNTVYN